MVTQDGVPPREDVLEAQIALANAAGRGFAFASAADETREWQPGEPGGFAYAYRKGELLTRTQDLGRALDSVTGRELGVRVPPERDEEAPDPAPGVELLELPGDAPLPEVVRQFDAELGPGVVTPHHGVYVVRSSVCPASEPLEALGAHAPWPRDPGPGGGRGVRVVVVDTGFDPASQERHDWLKRVQWDQVDVDPVDVFDVTPGSMGPGADGFIDPYCGHGTFIAGVVGANAPEAEVRVIRLDLDLGYLARHQGGRNSYSAGLFTELELVGALFRALSFSPDIISLSAGCSTRHNLHPLALADFGEELAHHDGVVLVAAAGNDGGREEFWPAAFPWALAVGALGADDRIRADYSNYGSWVEVYAPGTEQVNAFPQGEYRYTEPPRVGGPDGDHSNGMAVWSGTSFSAPFVAARIAEAMSVNGWGSPRARDAVVSAAVANATPSAGPRVL